MSQRIWPWSGEPSEAAEAIMFAVSAATGDPKAAIMRLLRRYLADVQKQAYTDVLRGKPLEQRD
jgi:hypothetical protein